MKHTVELGADYIHAKHRDEGISYKGDCHICNVELTKLRKSYTLYSLIFILVEFFLIFLFLTVLKDFSIIILILNSLISIFFSVSALKFWHKEVDEKGLIEGRK